MTTKMRENIDDNQVLGSSSVTILHMQEIKSLV